MSGKWPLSSEGRRSHRACRVRRARRLPLRLREVSLPACVTPVCSCSVCTAPVHAVFIGSGVHRRLSTMAAMGKHVIDTPATVVATVDTRPDLNWPIIDDLASNVMSKISGGAVIPLKAAEK